MKIIIGLLIQLFLLSFICSYGQKTTRSVSSGDWHTSGTWSNGVPIAGDEVFIENGDVVTISAVGSATTLNIEDNASSLTISSNTLTLNNLNITGTANSQTNTITVNGTLNANNFSYKSEGFSNLTLTVNGSGNAILNNNLNTWGTLGGSQTLNWEVTGQFKKGIYHYAANSSGRSSFVLKDSISVKTGMLFQAAGTAIAANVLLDMNNASARLKLDGPITESANGGSISTGANQSIVYTNNLINLIDDVDFEFYDIVLSNSSTLSSNVSLNYSNNFTIASNTTLTTGGFDLSLPGNLINNGSMSMSAGDNLVFNGNSAQTISSSNDLTLTTLDISNSSGGVSISGTGNVNITQGVIFTTAAATALTTGGKLTLKDNGSGMAYLGNLNSHSISGNLTCEFRTQTLSNIEYRMFTVPVSGQTLGSVDFDASSCPNCFYSYGFTGSNTPSSGGVASTYSYNNGSVASDFDEGWTMASNTSNAVSPQQGLTWYIGPGSGSGSAASYEIDVTGAANTGPYTINTANGANFTASGSGAEFNWALVGNPFPSTINFATVTQNNVDKDPWLFKADNGGYAIDNTIPPFQAFFVKLVGSGASLVFNESDKVTTQKVYQKNFKAGEEIQVKLSTPLYPNKFNYTYLRFNKNASNGFDSLWDKEMFASNPFPYPNVSMKTDDGKNTYRYVTHPEQGHIAIPINAHGYTSGTYELSFANLGSMEGCLILEDTYTGQTKGLSAVDSTYSFSLSDTTKGARFILHVYNTVEKLSVNNSTCFGDSAGSAELNFYNHGSYFTTWYDANGKYVAGGPFAEISERAENLAPGNYSIEIQSNELDCPIATEYFTIHEPSEITAGFGFANQLLSFRTNKAIEFKNLSSGGISDYLWDFGDQMTATEENPTHTYTTPGVYDVVLTVGNGNADCNVMHKQSLEVAEATGLQELSEAAGYQLVQNNGTYTIHFNQPAVSDLNYRVFDIQGKLLNNGNLKKGTMVDEIEIKGSGIVLVNIQYNNETETVKIVQQ